MTCANFHAFVPGLFVGYALCLFSLAILATLLYLFKAPPVTMHGRRNRPQRHLYSELVEGMEDLARQREEGVRYEFMNLTGLEDR